MGTSIRLFLSPKLLTPKSPIRCNKLPQINHEKRHSKLSRQLYCTSPNVKISNNNYVTSKEHDIHIKISDFGNDNVVGKTLIVKTPEKYEILRNGLEEFDLNILGRGSFGTVVKGIYKSQEVAVKVVKLPKTEEIIRETKVLNFNHVNLIKIKDVLINTNMNYAMIIMEYLNSSQHLQKLLDEEDFAFTRDVIVRYGLDIAKGLDYCHRNNVVHMDLKPLNVLVYKNVCKLCDFGNCFEVGENAEDYQFKGTIAYTSPEILMGKGPSFKSDIYSFGIVLWQMITGDVPYATLDFEIIVYKVVKFGLRPNELSNQKDDFLKDLYTKCWSLYPGDRPNCAEIMNSLE